MRWLEKPQYMHQSPVERGLDAQKTSTRDWPVLPVFRHIEAGQKVL
jgi:hypothetical protein